MLFAISQNHSIAKVKRKMLTFLSISLEKRQNSNLHNTKFAQALLHKNSAGKVSKNNTWWTVNPRKRLNKFPGYVFSCDFFLGVNPWLTLSHWNNKGKNILFANNNANSIVKYFDDDLSQQILLK